MFQLGGLSLGCAQLGNLYREVSDADAHATVDAAWDCRRALLRHRAALRPRPLRAPARRGARRAAARRVRGLDEGRPRCSSRCRRRPGAGRRRVRGPGDPPPASGTSAATASAARSRRASSASVSTASTSSTSTIPTTTGTRCSTTGYPALAELRAEGVVSRHRRRDEPVRDARRLVRHTDVDVLMLAGRYTLLEQDALDDLLPLCEERGVARRRGRCLQQRPARPAAPGRRRGATTTARRRPRSSSGRARSPTICERHGTTLPAAAIAFPLAHPAVVSVCVGARSAEQIERNASLYRESIAPDLWRELKAEGLLREDAPVPV